MDNHIIIHLLTSPRLIPKPFPFFLGSSFASFLLFLLIRTTLRRIFTVLLAAVIALSTVSIVILGAVFIRLAVAVSAIRALVTFVVAISAVLAVSAVFIALLVLVTFFAVTIFAITILAIILITFLRSQSGPGFVTVSIRIGSGATRRSLPGGIPAVIRRPAVIRDPTVVRVGV
jgi:hypothetical protein